MRSTVVRISSPSPPLASAFAPDVASTGDDAVDLVRKMC
jgi:hypothetical protein